MGFFSRLFHWSADSPAAEIGTPEVNPATGLPMVDDGIGGVDVAGNPWGADLHEACGHEIDHCFDFPPSEF